MRAQLIVAALHHQHLSESSWKGGFSLRLSSFRRSCIEGRQCRLSVLVPSEEEEEDGVECGTHLYVQCRCE